jgi:hypothetical protein
MKGKKEVDVVALQNELLNKSDLRKMLQEKVVSINRLESMVGNEITDLSLDSMKSVGDGDMYLRYSCVARTDEFYKKPVKTLIQKGILIKKDITYAPDNKVSGVIKSIEAYIAQRNIELMLDVYPQNYDPNKVPEIDFDM